jgi:threonine/homoserine/homoserine lactone efflux protein
VFVFPLAFSPGPGNTVFAAIGALFGLAASVPISAGYHAATWVASVAIGLGFAEILLGMPALFTVIKYAGSAYVLCLAWLFLRAEASERGEAARRAGFRDGAVLLLLDPKAYLIISPMFAQFLTPEAGDPLPAVIPIATVFTLDNRVAFTAWTAAGDLLGRLFADGRSAGDRRRFRAGAGGRGRLDAPGVRRARQSPRTSPPSTRMLCPAT